MSGLVLFLFGVMRSLWQRLRLLIPDPQQISSSQPVKRLCMSALFGVLVLPLVQGTLLASGGGEHGGAGNEASAMFQDILVLLAVISVAYLMTHLFLERIQRRYGLVSGVEYIILGVLIGPVLGLLDASTLSKFTPALVLGTGSLGLMAGLNMNFRRFEAMDFEAMRVALWISMVTLIVMVILPLLVLYAMTDIETTLKWGRVFLCVGAIAMVADASPVQSLRHFMGAQGAAADAAIRVAKFCSVMAVFSFGLIFCMFDHETVFLPEGFRMLEWFIVHLLLGVALGLVFAQFLRRDLDEDKSLAVIIGVVIFTSGIAYYLRLSPVFVNVILGIVLANVSKQHEQVAMKLRNVKRPLYIVLFFFAGATLSLSTPIWAYFLAIPYLLMRTIARTSGGIIAMRTTPDQLGTFRIPALGRVVLAPGALSVALLLDFDSVYGTFNTSSILYGGALVAILMSEMISYTRTRSWLLDHTDVAPGTIRQVLSGEDVEVA